MSELLSPTAIEILRILNDQGGDLLSFDELRRRRSSNGASTSQVLRALRKRGLVDHDGGPLAEAWDVSWRITPTGLDCLRSNQVTPA